MIVGLTGGIGSGKSTIAQMFMKLGVPVYIADDRAKWLMVNNLQLVNAIKNLLGSEAYTSDELNRAYIASVIFSDSTIRNQLNALVHPAVALDFKEWASLQDAPYVLKEAAILFENGSYKDTDFNILVTAPKEERIHRVMKRDAASRAHIEKRMEAQWGDAQKIALADVFIQNIDIQKTKKEVLRIHNHLLRRSQQGW